MSTKNGRNPMLSNKTLSDITVKDVFCFFVFVGLVFLLGDWGGFCWDVAEGVVEVGFGWTDSLILLFGIGVIWIVGGLLMFWVYLKLFNLLPEKEMKSNNKKEVP